MNVEPRTGRFDIAFELPGSTLSRRAAAALHRHRDRNRRGRGADALAAAGRGHQGVRRDDGAPAQDRARAATASRAEQAVGLAAKSALRSGQALRTDDLIKPQIVQRNEAVTITYEVPGIMLTVRGKALEAGALGDVVGVLNIQSNRTVQATVTGPGRVTIAAARPLVAAAAAPATDDQASPQHPVSVPTMHPRLVSRPQSSRVAAGSLGGCCRVDRLAQIGEQPPLSAIENPTTQPGYKPVQMPMPTPQPASYSPNSLWRNGSRAFFKDQRAHQVGDILTVTVNLNDKAVIANETQRSRENKEDSGVDDFFGSKTDQESSDRDPARPHPHRRFQRFERRQGLGEPLRGAGHQRRRRGHPGAAERQPRGRGQAGGPRQLRDPRADRRRHRAAGGHPERQHHRLDQDRRRRGSPMAAAARSPMCSSRVTASRCWMCCCRSKWRQSLSRQSVCQCLLQFTDR